MEVGVLGARGGGTASVQEGLLISVWEVVSAWGWGLGAGPARLEGKVGEAGVGVRSPRISLSSLHWPWPVGISSRGWAAGAGSVLCLPSLCPSASLLPSLAPSSPRGSCPP